ncbi:MAG TPA: hypothetical protein VKQ32_10495 [Polyangia bacterium]|nr:hypothetical protein [Polyangia bacterium]
MVVAPGKIESGDVWTNEPVYDPVRGPKEEVKPPTADSTEATSPQLAAQRGAEAAAAQALADQRKAEDAQRAKNKADSGYGVTDAELARLKSDAASQNLTQQQIDQRGKELEATSAARSRELDIAAANNQIAAANQALASKRLELDQIVRDDASKLDWAKFEYLKAKDATDNQIAQAKLDLERLTQQQTTAAQTAANVLAQQTLEQRKAEAAQKAAVDAATLEQNAQTAAAQGATGQLSAIAQGATAGANLLQNRVTNAQNFVQEGLGILGRGQKGLLVAPPADFAQNLTQGAAAYATQLGGGPEVYQAAANLVRRADPTGSMGQDAGAAFAALTQMFQRYRQTHGGQPAPQEVQALQPTPQSFTSPALPTQSAQQAAGMVSSPGQVAGQNYGYATAFPGGGAGGYANTPLPAPFAQSGLPEGRSVAVAPTATVPMTPSPTFSMAPMPFIAPVAPITPSSRNITITVPTG